MLDRLLQQLPELLEDPDDVEYMIVILPGNIDPFERHYRFSVFVDAELRLARLGCSVGGGTLYREEDQDEDEDSEPVIAHCVLDVDARDVTAVRALLREHLPELGCPPGTLVQYDDALEDRYDGEVWHLGEPRSIDQFGGLADE
jgi:hypothetical protein